MAEVTGLVLGAMPLIISVLKHHDELSEYTLAFFRWQKAKSLMTRQLALCQVDFELNMRLLLKDAVSPEKHFEMIENPQHVSWKDGEFLQKIEQKLGKSYALLISILRDIEGTMVWITSSLDIAGSDEVRQQLVNQVSRSQTNLNSWRKRDWEPSYKSRLLSPRPRIRERLSDYKSERSLHGAAIRSRLR
jgi:hypothetical protein